MRSEEIEQEIITFTVHEWGKQYLQCTNESKQYLKYMKESKWYCDNDDIIDNFYNLMRIDQEWTGNIVHEHQWHKLFSFGNAIF